MKANLRSYECQGSHQQLQASSCLENNIIHMLLNWAEKRHSVDSLCDNCVRPFVGNYLSFIIIGINLVQKPFKIFSKILSIILK
ncbi:Protein of unknown function, partial [Gryllus bimaculatus]